jgi:FSR family fosmidomycin resistance protein-like MFS transporter
VIAEETRAGRLDGRLLGPVSAGHFCTDLCQGALPALLPFLIVQRGLSLAAAAALITAATIGSSVIQPLFGIWSDRLTRPALMPTGVALAAAGIGLAGLFHSYPMIVGSVAVIGLGVAAFHPEAARVANAVSAARAGAGMSYFAVGGNLGYAIGPLITVPIVLTLGLDGTPLIAVPGLLAAAIIVRRLPLLRRHLVSCEVMNAPRGSVRPDAWFPFARLVGIAVLRTVPFFTLQALVPIYFVRHFRAGTALGGAALTLMLIGGAAGTLIGGRCADRYGRKPVIVGAMVPLTLLLFTLRFASVAEFVVLLVAVGLVLEGPFSTTVLIGQEYLPGRVGLASGVTYGLAIGLGGMIASALGALAGETGIAFVIELLPGFTVLSLVLALSLPDPLQPTAGRSAARLRALPRAGSAPQEDQVMSLRSGGESPAPQTRQGIPSRSDARRARRS